MDDLAVFEDLVQARQRELFALLLARLGDREEALDQLQECLLAAWRNRRRFLDLPPIERDRYLFAIARNKARDAGRKRLTVKRTATRALAEGEDPPRLMATEDPRMDALERAIADLDDDDRELLQLATVGDLDSEALAVRLGTRPGTVRSRLSRIRARLRERVDALLLEESR